MRKLIFISVLFFSANSFAGGLADGGKVLELYSLTNIVATGNTTPDTGFSVKIDGSGLCAGSFIKFQTNVNSNESLDRSFSMLMAAYVSGKRVAIKGAYNNSNCELGSQVRFID